MNASRTENNFDIIRLVAAVMVIITHSYALAGKSENDLLSSVTCGALQFSHLGVAIFFVISGYLITQSAFSCKTWKGYLWRRFLRIFPGLMVVLLFSSFLLGPLLTHLELSTYLRSPLTYLHLCSISLYRLYLNLPGVFSSHPNHSVNGSLWTLAYEFTMYISILIAHLLGLLNRRYMVAAIWIAMFALRIYVGKDYFVYSYSTPFLLGLNITYFFEWSFFFLSGTAIYLFREELNFNFYGLAGFFILYITSAVLKNEDALRILNYLIVPYTIFTLAFVKSRLSEIGKLGDFSYGVYIYAFPVQQTIIHFAGTNLPTLVVIILSIVFTFPFAFASWHLIEKKFLALKNRIN